MAAIEKGFCQCGCGERTKLATKTNRRDGHVKGEPLAYVLGHTSKARRLPAGPVLCACGCGTELARAMWASHQVRYVRGHRRAYHDDAAIAKRFWSRVDKDGPVPAHRPDLGPCWVFTGSDKGPWGHGRMHARKERTLAHRLSWEMANGPIPDGLQVLHHCDNGACVRPDHLFLGTQADNMRDMDAKGRRGTHRRPA